MYCAFLFRIDSRMNGDFLGLGFDRHPSLTYCNLVLAARWEFPRLENLPHVRWEYLQFLLDQFFHVEARARKLLFVDVEIARCRKV